MARNVIAQKHFFQLARPAFDRAGEIKILIEDGIEVERLVAKFAQSCNAGLEHFRLEVAGRRDDADGVPVVERRRLDARG